METFARQSFCPLSFFVKRRRLTSFLSVLLTLSLLNLLTGCSYYNVRNLTTTSETLAGQINEFAENQQYVVIHSGQDTWHLTALRVNEQEKTMSGMVQHVGAKHIPKKPRETKTTHQYTGGKEVLNEVHFYISSQKEITYGEQATIPFSEITSISVNDKNTGRSVANIVLGTVGVIAAIFIIVLLTKSSCPFIYVNNGGEYVFTGELYPGVLTANQQRDDYLALPNLEETNYEYRIKITNELKEIQHTDLVQLIEIMHPENVKVLLDANGKPHTFSKLIAPYSVMVDNLNGDTGPVLAKDNTSYLFNTALNTNSSKRAIEMTFKKPEQVAKAKLYLTVKNSLWLDYVFGKFNEKFGTYYPQFQKDQQEAPKENSIKWMNEQSIPLSVYVKTITGWDLVERLNTVGPMASRDIAVPIDMTNLTGNEVVIRLETGFMFWEVDYAGIDFTENSKVTINYINPSLAVDGDEKDVTKLLLAEDQNYLVQPNVGDEVVVHFKAFETKPTVVKTFFLKNRGYYNYVRNYDGEPNFQELKLFRTAGAFTDFSMYEYEALMEYENQFDLAENSK